MSEEVKQEIKQDESTECSRKSSPQFVWFVARVSADDAHQMQVFRYLHEAPQYRCISILHDRDIANSEDVGKHYTKSDGTKAVYALGDPKPPHYHMIIKVQRKITVRGMQGRFGGYVMPQKCGDPVESAYYLTHETFMSKDKYKYSRNKIEGDLNMYNDLIKAAKTEDFANNIRAYRDALDSCSGSKVGAIEYLLKMGDVQTVKNIMSHAYFYKTFCTEEEGGEEDDSRRT